MNRINKLKKIKLTGTLLYIYLEIPMSTSDQMSYL